MYIRDELTLRILIALIDNPLHAYAIIQQMQEDGALLLPVEERAVYRMLPRLIKLRLITSDGDDKKPAYHLEAKAYHLLTAHKVKTNNLMDILRDRLAHN